MSICLDHERSSAMVTPKYFAAGILSSSTLCRMYLVLRGFAFFVIWRTWHLEGLNCISHIFSNCSRLARSVCRTSLSVVELIARYKAVSSAKSLTLDLTCSGRSFMYARKRIGPRTEPCGTLEETEIFSEHSVNKALPVNSFSNQGRFGRVVSAKFWGESIWPILVGHSGRGSFRPNFFWGGEGGCGGEYSTYVGLDFASTVCPIKISGISGIPK